MKIVNGLTEATGTYQRCLKNIHTEFLANEGKFLSLIKCNTTSRVEIDTDSFSNEAMQRVVHLLFFF